MTVNSIHHPVVDEVIASSIRGVAAAAAPVAIAVGLLVLLGWWLDVDWLKSVHPGWVSMKANSAAAFGLCGASLAAIRWGAGAPARYLARACAGVVTLVGVIVLLEYAAGSSTGIDRLLFDEQSGAAMTPFPGRMSPGSAVGFLCCGASLLLIGVASRRARSTSQWLALVPLAVGYVGLVNYLFRAGPLFPAYVYTPIAVHTAVVFALMGIGLLGTRPDHGFMAMATGATAGGVVLRRLLPVAVVLVPTAFWIKHEGIQFGWYDHDTADMLLLITSVLALVALVCWSAIWLNRLERRWREAVRSATAVTEREALAQSLARVGVWEWDIKSNQSNLSEQARALMGLPSDHDGSFEGWLEVVDPRDRAEMRRVIFSLVGSPGEFSFEFRVDVGGQTRWLMARGSVVCDAEGAPERLLGVEMDITERKAIEAALRESAKRLELVQQVAGIGVWEWDMESGRLRGSAQSRAQYGIEDARAVRGYEDWLALVHPADRAAIGAGVRDLFDDPRPFSTEFRIVRPDGAVRWILTQGDAIRDAEGRPRYLLGINMDVTERRRTEETLRQAQRMDAVGQMAGGIAHDFNNVLGIILGNLGLLKRSLPEDPKMRQRVDNIERSAQRAADLTSRLLGFSRRDPALVEVVDVNRVITEMETLIARALTPEIAVNRRLADDAWPVELDPGQFEDALVNLVLNARDAMSGGGELEIATGNAAIDAAFCRRHPGAREGEFVHVSVSDTGEGIAAEALDKIFDPFFTTKPRGKGTGLGLAMVLGFVTRSGGFVTVESTIATGTTFSLYLPRTEKQPGEARAPADASVGSAGGGETILVVDDEEELRELTAELLGSLGYRVVTAQDGQQALEQLAKDESIALVFSDVVMPGGINGVALAERASRLRPGLKVLLTSGQVDASAASTASHGLDVLVKPYGEEELVRRIRALLDTPVEANGGTYSG